MSYAYVVVHKFQLQCPEWDLNSGERNREEKEEIIQDRLSAWEYVTKISCIRSVLDKLQPIYLDDSYNSQDFFSSFIIFQELYVKETVICLLSDAVSLCISY